MMSKIKDYEERLKEARQTRFDGEITDVTILRLAREIFGEEDKYFDATIEERDGLLTEVEKLKAEIELLKHSSQFRRAEAQQAEIASLKKQLAQAQGKGLSREEIAKAIRYLKLFNGKNLHDLIGSKGMLQIADALLQHGSIGGKMTREHFRSIMCGFTPTICEDSQQPEWSQLELNRAFDALYGKGEGKQWCQCESRRYTSASTNPLGEWCSECNLEVRPQEKEIELLIVDSIGMSALARTMLKVNELVSAHNAKVGK
jgi:hypothetical protein